MPNEETNKLVIQLRGFDAKHYAATERYAKQIERLYKTACDEFAVLAGGVSLPEDATFSFDDYPKAKKQAQGILTRLTKKVEAVITTGTTKEWAAACEKNDAFISAILRTSKLTREEAEQYQARNLEALATFQRRKVAGLGLSQRVWKYADELKDAMELGIDVGLGEGRSAQQLSRDLRSYLKEPNKLYRRVRDKGGNLRLSRAAKMYHPGQGVYRSSAKNAQRLTRTEINMAYRESEFLRWQKLDFVVGIRILLSNNHTTKNSKGETVPLVDICDELWGDYPKTFKFVGWHPQCRCFVVPILVDYDEFKKERAGRLMAIAKGEAYKSLPSRRTVTDVPAKFREYIASIQERAKGWKAMPYYIRDNFKGGKISGGLNGSIPTKTMNTVEPCKEYDGEIRMYKRWAYAFGLDVSGLDALRTAGNKTGLRAALDALRERAEKIQDEWLDEASNLGEAIVKLEEYPELKKEYSDILKANKVDTNHYYGDCIPKLKQAIIDAAKALFKKKEEDAKQEYSKKMPEALKNGKAYLLGEDYVFSKDFFDLLTEMPQLEILHGNGGSYETNRGKKVVLDNDLRMKASAWFKKKLVYHEFGHAIADQRSLLFSTEVQELRAKQIKRLRKKVKYYEDVYSYDLDKGEMVVVKEERNMMKAKEISLRLDRLLNKIRGMKPETFTKRGITKDDVIEQITSTQDTLKSLINSVGWGHSTNYFKMHGMSEHEYLAHSFENAFIGNRVFQKYLPVEYAEMIALVRSFKKP